MEIESSRILYQPVCFRNKNINSYRKRSNDYPQMTKAVRRVNNETDVTDCFSNLKQ